MPHTFTSLRHPLEKLLETEHFLGRLLLAEDLEFQFELNAFLSACRSVSFVLQKTMASVSGFDTWYAHQQQKMREDAEMRFFLNLRNKSQKMGPVSYVSGGNMAHGQMSAWSHRFVVSRATDVPVTLRERDIANCCASHLMKLAALVLECAQAFPFHACPGHALTEEGMKALNYGFRDIEAALGLPSGYVDVGDFPLSERLRVLRQEFYVLEWETIERMAAGDFRRGDASLKFPVDPSRRDLIDDVATIINESGGQVGVSRDVFIRAAMKRISDLD